MLIKAPPDKSLHFAVYCIGVFKFGVCGKLYIKHWFAKAEWGSKHPNRINYSKLRWSLSRHKVINSICVIHLPGRKSRQTFCTAGLTKDYCGTAKLYY